MLCFVLLCYITEESENTNCNKTLTTLALLTKSTALKILIDQIFSETTTPKHESYPSVWNIKGKICKINKELF
jgi:hypothetical protein